MPRVDALAREYLNHRFTPMADLLLTILDNVDVPETLRDTTGRLPARAALNRLRKIPRASCVKGAGGCP
jgi:hypothetical protein